VDGPSGAGHGSDTGPDQSGDRLVTQMWRNKRRVRNVRRVVNEPLQRHEMMMNKWMRVNEVGGNKEGGGGGRSEEGERRRGQRRDRE